MADGPHIETRSQHAARPVFGGLRARAMVATLVAGLMLCITAPATLAQQMACEAPACPGLELSAGYTADFRRNTRGGFARGNAWSGLLEAGVAWRSDEVLPAGLLSTSASLIHVSGDGISGERVGDLQGLNNIEADSGWYLYDLWAEVAFGARQAASVRAGFLDLNAEFDSSDTAGFFVSPPFGIGTDLAQTGENGPAVFPVTALGVRLDGQAGALQWRLAAFEGSPGRTDRHRFATIDYSRAEGALLAGELQFAAARLHKLAIGAWTYTARFERIDAASSGDVARRRGNRGAYAMVDAPLGALGQARLDGMLRAGFAAARFNASAHYAGAAVVASNLLPGRPDDGLGLAIAHARTGRQFRSQLAFDGGSPARSETALELTWRAPLAPWIAIVPSLQWIDSPGADRSRRDAFVAGARVEVSWERSWSMQARAPPPQAMLFAASLPSSP
jgi:porin